MYLYIKYNLNEIMSINKKKKLIRIKNTDIM